MSTKFGSWKADALVITERKKARCLQWKVDSYHRLSEKAQKLEMSSTSGQRKAGRAKTGELAENLCKK